MRKFWLAVVVMLAGLLYLGIASAQSTAPGLRTHRYGTRVAGTLKQFKVLDGAALNAAAASRTFTLDVSGMSVVSIQIDLTRTAATDLQLTCLASLNGGVSYGEISSTSVSGGTGTMTAYHDVFPLSANHNLIFDYYVGTKDNLKCTVSGTSGGANDTIDVYAVSAVGL
jgi:hypothetical protein